MSTNIDPGLPVVSHVYTFGEILNQVSRSYSYRWDEAVRHLPANALAMRRDCYLRSLLQERYVPTVNAEWQLTPENQGDAAQREAARVLTDCLKWTPRWKVLIHYLLEAVWYGRYGAQVTYRRQIVDGAARWVVKSHTPVNGDKIQYTWDGVPIVFIYPTELPKYPEAAIVYTDRVPGLKLMNPTWRKQFILHRHVVDDADYFEAEMAGAVMGVGLRSMIYWAWWLRDEMLSWAVDFLKKVGTLGLLVFWFEQGNKGAQKAAETAAQQASKDVALVLPRPIGSDKEAWGVQHLPASTSGIDALRSMVQEYFERHMERLIVGQMLSAGTEGSGLGGSGVAELHEQTKHQLVKFDAENLAETLTDDLVMPLLRLNFPGAEYRVRFEFILEKPNPEKKLQAVQEAAGLGVRFGERDVRSLTGLPEPAPGEPVVGGPAVT